MTPSFLKNIPPKCYITLSESYYENIFGNIPAFVLLPSPINFTTTSQEVYDAISNKKIIYYTIYLVAILSPLFSYFLLQNSYSRIGNVDQSAHFYNLLLMYLCSLSHKVTLHTVFNRLVRVFLVPTIHVFHSLNASFKETLNWCSNWI